MVNTKFPFKSYWFWLYKKEIEALSEVLIKNKNVYILSDDIYEHIIYDNFNFFTIAQIKELKKQNTYNEWC